jgi:predicted ATPase
VLDEFTDLSEKYGFRFYIAFARIYRGLVNIKRGRVGEGGDLLKEGIDIQQLSGDRSFESWRQIQLAQFNWELGEFQQALVLVDEALVGARHKGQGRFEWESNYLRGKILASLPQPDYRATEDCLMCVIESARHRAAKFWELRSSTSLARLWGEQGKRAEARELLAPIYNWFTEGFDTPDLMEAKALLNTLASA